MLKKILLGLAVVLVLGLVVVPLVTRPWQVRWGASDDEVNASLPGDDLVPKPDSRQTRAITIDAPPAKVWPWIVQVGYQRAGWYTYDAFYKATGSAEFVDGHSSRRIVPELQDLKVGDKIYIAKPLSYAVVEMAPPQYMVWQGAGTAGRDMTGTIDPSAAPAKTSNNTWVYMLLPLDGGKRTRLIMRQAGWSNDPTMRAFTGGPFEFGGFLMARKHLLGIKARAEGRVR